MPGDLDRKISGRPACMTVWWSPRGVRSTVRGPAQESGGPLVLEDFSSRSPVKAHCNSAVESDHARLKARLRPMRGLKRFRSAARIAAGHAFVQNLRRSHYELATDTAPPLRLATAFIELALAM
jgi:hypothetical protein